MSSIETLAEPARVGAIPLYAATLPSLNGNRPAVHHGVRRKRFSVDVAGVTDLLVAAVNANNWVLSYVNALANTPIPALPGTPPSWWASFVNQWPTVNSNALVWVNSVSPQITAIPQTIINFNHLFAVNVKQAQQNLDLLIKNPNDTQAQQDLARNLSLLSDNIGDQQTSVAAFMTMIDNFSTALASDETTLQTAVQNALNTVGVDEAQIAQLATAIGELKHQIATYNQIVVAAEIGVGVSIFVGAVGTALAFATFGVGAVLILVGAIGIAASITVAVTYSQKVQEAEAMVSRTSAAMDALTQQVAVLSTLNTSLSDIISLSQAAQKYVKAIAAQWNVVQTDIDKVVEDLNSAESALTSDDYTAIQSDLNDAAMDWGKLTDAVQGLADITYNVSSTPVMIPAK